MANPYFFFPRQLTKLQQQWELLGTAYAKHPHRYLSHEDAIAAWSKRHLFTGDSHQHRKSHEEASCNMAIKGEQQRAIKRKSAENMRKDANQVIPFAVNGLYVQEAPDHFKVKEKVGVETHKALSKPKTKPPAKAPLPSTDILSVRHQLATLREVCKSAHIFFHSCHHCGRPI